LLNRRASSCHRKRLTQLNSLNSARNDSDFKKTEQSCLTAPVEKFDTLKNTLQPASNMALTGIGHICPVGNLYTVRKRRDRLTAIGEPSGKNSGWHLFGVEKFYNYFINMGRFRNNRVNVRSCNGIFRQLQKKFKSFYCMRLHCH